MTVLFWAVFEDKKGIKYDFLDRFESDKSLSEFFDWAYIKRLSLKSSENLPCNPALIDYKIEKSQ